MTHLPIILIDLLAEEGVVGRSYLKPYLLKTMKYLIASAARFWRDAQKSARFARRSL
jgi:mandelate racemase